MKIKTARTRIECSIIIYFTILVNYRLHLTTNLIARGSSGRVDLFLPHYDAEFGLAVGDDCETASPAATAAAHAWTCA